MKLFKSKSSRQWKDYAAALCVAVLFYVCLSHINLLFVGIGKLIYFISPILTGIAIAYIINPLANLVRKYLFCRVRKDSVRWGLSVTVTILLLIFLIVILLVALIPQLIDSVVTFIGNLNDYSKSLNKWLNSLSDSASQLKIDISGLTNLGENAMSKLVDLITSNSDSIVDTVTGIGSGVMNGVISFIISIYILLDKRRILRGFGRFNRLLFSEKHYTEAANFWGRCNEILIRFIGFDLIDGAIIGVANAVFMSIAGMPYNALISVVVGVTNLAPTFGPIVGGVIGSLILLLVNPMYVVYFLIFTVCLQTIDGYVLKPKLFGGSLGVPGLWILICITAFGRMFGVIGILLGIPLAAILDFIYHDYLLPKMEEWKERRKKKAAEQEKEQSGLVVPEDEDESEGTIRASMTGPLHSDSVKTPGGMKTPDGGKA